MRQRKVPTSDSTSVVEKPEVEHERCDPLGNSSFSNMSFTDATAAISKTLTWDNIPDWMKDNHVRSGIQPLAFRSKLTRVHWRSRVSVHSIGIPKVGATRVLDSKPVALNFTLGLRQQNSWKGCLYSIFGCECAPRCLADKRLLT